MLKRSSAKRLCVVAAFFLTTAAQASTPASNDPAAKLGEMLDRVEYLEGFFVDRTENYIYSISEMEREASIKIYRGCGANCRNFASDVVRHLREAKPVQCKDGQENVLLKIGDKGVIIYRRRGILIEFDGTCSLNETPVNYVLERSNWWFH